MSRVASKNTSPEIRVRKCLHRLGYRFRLHKKDLPGHPDIVLAKSKTVIFVHGCFWHRHINCTKATNPKTRVEFWQDKFAANVRKFDQVDVDLRALGWRVLVIWECETKTNAEIETFLRASLCVG